MVRAGNLKQRYTTDRTAFRTWQAGIPGVRAVQARSTLPHCACPWFGRVSARLPCGMRRHALWPPALRVAERMKGKVLEKAISKVLGATLLGLMALSPQDAQAQRLENGTRFGGWTVACEALAVNETVCVLSQRLVSAADGSLLADLLAFASTDEPAGWVAARVPNGVFLPSGFSFRVDDAENGEERIDTFEWQSCSPDICEALLRIDSEIASALDTLPDWVAAYRPAIDASPLVFRVDPSGLADGLSALAAALDQPDPFAADASVTE